MNMVRYGYDKILIEVQYEQLREKNPTTKHPSWVLRQPVFFSSILNTVIFLLMKKYFQMLVYLKKNLF